MGNDKYQALFFEESDEYLYILNDRILLLEENPEDSTLIDEIFRAAHTLKGMAATMGYDDMSDLTHSMENVFELFRGEKIAVSTEIISLIFKCLDRLSDIVEDLRAGNSGEIDVKDLIEELNTVENNDEYTSELSTNNIEEGDLSSSDYLVIEKARAEGYEAYDIMIEISEDCTLKGPRAFLVVTKLKEEGELLASFPPIEELENGVERVLGRVILYSPENMGAMLPIDETSFYVGDTNLRNSIGNPEGFGIMMQGYLEGSNVDMADSMVDMITTQRAYSMNSKTIQTVDDIMLMINNLKR